MLVLKVPRLSHSLEVNPLHLSSMLVIKYIPTLADIQTSPELLKNTANTRDGLTQSHTHTKPTLIV